MIQAVTAARLSCRPGCGDDDDHQQNRKHFTWVGDGDAVGDGGGGGGAVDRVGVGDGAVLLGAADGVVDCAAGAEVAAVLGFSEELGDAEPATELGPAAEAEPPPAAGADVGAAEIELAPAPSGAEIETAATRRIGVLPPPAGGRLAAKTSTPTRAIPRQPPAILSPVPRRFRGLPPRWPLTTTSSAAPCAESRGRARREVGDDWPGDCSAAFGRSPDGWCPVPALGIQAVDREPRCLGAAIAGAPQPGQDTAPLRYLRHALQ